MNRALQRIEANEQIQCMAATPHTDTSQTPANMPSTRTRTHTSTSVGYNYKYWEYLENFKCQCHREVRIYYPYILLVAYSAFPKTTLRTRVRSRIIRTDTQSIVHEVRNSVDHQRIFCNFFVVPPRKRKSSIR